MVTHARHETQRRASPRLQARNRARAPATRCTLIARPATYKRTSKQQTRKRQGSKGDTLPTGQPAEAQGSAVQGWASLLHAAGTQSDAEIPSNRQDTVEETTRSLQTSSSNDYTEAEPTVTKREWPIPLSSFLSTCRFNGAINTARKRAAYLPILCFPLSGP